MSEWAAGCAEWCLLEAPPASRTSADADRLLAVLGRLARSCRDQDVRTVAPNAWRWSRDLAAEAAAGPFTCPTNSTNRSAAA